MLAANTRSNCPVMTEIYHLQSRSKIILRSAVTGREADLGHSLCMKKNCNIVSSSSVHVILDK